MDNPYKPDTTKLTQEAVNIRTMLALENVSDTLNKIASILKNLKV